MVASLRFAMFARVLSGGRGPDPEQPQEPPFAPRRAAAAESALEMVWEAAMGDTQSREQGLNIRIAALEVIIRRLVSEGERRTPGLIDRLAGPYDLKGRPTSDMDAFVGAVDDQVSTLLALARAESREAEDGE